MSAIYRRIVRLLTSGGFVSVVLGMIGLWSIVATVIPQGDPTMGRALVWAEANPAFAPVVDSIGLHQAFSAPAFLVFVGMLALSTVLCSWQRTQVALKRSGALRAAARLTASDVAESNDALIPIPAGMGSSQALALAEQELEALGVKSRRAPDALIAATSPIAPWGSPVFHWALVGMMLFVLVSSFVRSDGLIGLAVGEVKPDAPASYGRLKTGSWHSWDGVSRSFRLDDFEPRFSAGGIDHGPVPTVSVLDADGNVLKTQPIYPNKMLHVGSLSVSAPTYGLSVALSLEDLDGTQIGTAAQLVDFDQAAPEGTVPLGAVPVFGGDGSTIALVHATVPLISEGGQFVQWLPKDSPARILVTAEDGSVITDSIVSQGDSIALPEDMLLRVTDVGWYSRLSVLDDWTTPYIYACMVIAMLALSLTVFTRQQYLVAAVTGDGEDAKLGLRMRLWRHPVATRNDIIDALTRALNERGDEAA